MSAEQHIARLDASLARHGQDITLMRNGISVTVRARKNIKDRPDELVSGNTVDDLLMHMSMTQIRATGWFAGTVSSAPYLEDNAVPRKGDVAVVSGKRYRVEVPDPVVIDNVVVRVNLYLKGAVGGV
jgi:hypothetical protein